MWLKNTYTFPVEVCDYSTKPLLFRVRTADLGAHMRCANGPPGNTIMLKSMLAMLKTMMATQLQTEMHECLLASTKTHRRIDRPI